MRDDGLRSPAPRPAIGGQHPSRAFRPPHVCQTAHVCQGIGCGTHWQTRTRLRHACQSLPNPFRWQTWASWHTWTKAKVVPCRTLVHPDKVFTLNKALIVRRVGTVCRPHRVSSGYWRRFVSRSVAKSHEESAAVHTTRPSQKGIETYRSLACPGRTRSRGIGHLVPRGGGYCDPLRCGCSTTAVSRSPKRRRRERRASSRSQSGAIMVNQVSGLSMSR